MNYAALAGLDYEVELDRFKLRIGPQYRHYGRKLFGDLAGAINQTYVGYDQNDKPFTNFLNISAYGDNVDAFSSQLGGSTVSIVSTACMPAPNGSHSGFMTAPM